MNGEAWGGGRGEESGERRGELRGEERGTNEERLCVFLWRKEARRDGDGHSVLLSFVCSVRAGT